MKANLSELKRELTNKCQIKKAWVDYVLWDTSGKSERDRFPQSQNVIVSRKVRTIFRELTTMDGKLSQF